MTDRNEVIPQVPSHFKEGSADHPTPPGEGTISDEAAKLDQARMHTALEAAPRAEAVEGGEESIVEQQLRALQRMAEDEQGRKP